MADSSQAEPLILQKEEVTSCLDSFLGLLLWVPLIIWDGLVVCKLWGWFIAPLGVTPIGIAQAIGIDVLAAVLIYSPNGKKIEGKVTPRILENAAAGAICLGFGYLAHLYM